MKSSLFFLSLVSLSLLLSGCSFDESFEKNQQHDGDDMNVIQNVWPQALDQMLRWLSVPVVSQSPSVQMVPSYTPTVVSQKAPVQTIQLPVTPAIPPEVVEPVVETSSSSTPSSDNRETEDD